MPYRVRLPDNDAHRLKETRNSSQTSVCLKATEKIIEKRVKSRKPYIPKHLMREVNKEELEGFHKRVKRVPKDMPFEDAYHRNKMCLTNVDETVFYDPMEKKKSEELISCIEMFEDPGPTADSNREPAKPESLSVDIRIAASIDKKPSASVDTLRLSEQPETEKSKSGGRIKNRKKKNKRNADADSLSVIPLQCQESSLEYRVRCRGDSEPFTKFRVLFDPEVKGKDPRKTSLHEDRRWLRNIDRQSITSIDRSPLNCVDRQSFKNIDRHLTVLVDTHIKVSYLEEETISQHIDR
ncbi:hypothetical protein F2Q69_00034964 [Brassica cretica]|uniref:Uncharacterized protein n=1 Tax=Brassica cretica TaxID=69181 RepID=A0A8S9SNE7_BRACR|nr:hypothetical protein F2Q69_00034964 [Brassica cretica]